MVNWLINRAKRTPYFHLPGYMNRWWLVPYAQVIKRKVVCPGFGQPDETATDGTGPVDRRERPIAWRLQQRGIAIRIHEILRSDLGRDPHDHPWPYTTVILKGGYHEHRFDDQGYLVSVKWHGPGSILRRPANSWHKLILPEGTTTTTLFITGRKCQTWGFNTPDGKVPYYDYKDAQS